MTDLVVSSNNAITNVFRKTVMLAVLLLLALEKLYLNFLHNTTADPTKPLSIFYFVFQKAKISSCLLS